MKSSSSCLPVSNLSNLNTLPTFFIHYTKLVDRYPLLANLCTQLNLTEFKIITDYDSEVINPLEFAGSKQFWEARIADIANILIANLLSVNSNNHDTYLALLKKLRLTNIPLPHWAHPRALKVGEISVLLKHHSAISLIANGHKNHGLICEDDLLFSNDTKNLFYLVIDQLSPDIDYVDLAGGACLAPCPQTELITSDRPNLAKLCFPRTRTNASYILSKRYANYIVQRFFPLVFPIDWHLQYIMNLNIHFNCYWAKNPVFIHGSETESISSWRENV